MNKIGKIFLIFTVLALGFNSSSINASAEEAEDNTIDTSIPVPPNGSPEGEPGVPEAEEDKIPSELEDQEQLKKEIIKKPIETPASVTGEKHQGSGTVVDFTVTGSKAFYTIEAQDNTLYYLIIDLDKTENNVYFLSEINGEQLSLGEVTSKAPATPQAPSGSNQNSQSSNSGDTVFYLTVAGAGVAFLVYMYFKKFKHLDFKKKGKASPGKEESEQEDDEYIYEDEESEEEEYIED